MNINCNYKFSEAELKLHIGNISEGFVGKEGNASSSKVARKRDLNFLLPEEEEKKLPWVVLSSSALVFERPVMGEPPPRQL